MSFVEENNLILVDKELKIYRYDTNPRSIFKFVLEDGTEITEEYVYFNDENDILKGIRKYIEKFKSDHIEEINRGFWLNIGAFHLHKVDENGDFHI